MNVTVNIKQLEDEFISQRYDNNVKHSCTGNECIW